MAFREIPVDVARATWARLARLVERNPSSDCWLWKGATTTGYGSVNIGGRSALAHRVSYVAHRGPIPAGMQLDHLCRVRHCVNPEHLEPVTNRTNCLRGNAPGAILHRANRCRNGHEMTPENTSIRPHGRVCRACKNAKSRAARAAQPEAERERRKARAERINARRRELYAINSERERQYARDYRENNRERRREWQRARRARINQGGDGMTNAANEPRT